MTKMPLIHGDMPVLADAIDLGVVPVGVAPELIDNADVGWNNTQIVPHVGERIPAPRRVLMAIQHYRGEGILTDEKLVPYRAELSGLGTLVFQIDRMGWGTDWVVLDRNGEVVK